MKNFIILIFVFTFVYTNANSESWEWFTTENSELPVNSIDNLVIDSNDNLWFHTDKSIYMFNQNENRWSEFNEENSNLKKGFTHIEIGKDKSVYVSSSNIYKFEESLMDFNIEVENINCDKFVFDDKNNLYFVIDLRVFKKNNENLIPIFNGILEGPNYPSNLIVDEDNVLWFGTDGFNSALYSYSDNELITFDSIFKEDPRIGINSISIDSKSNIWLGNGLLSIVLNYNIENGNWNYFDYQNSPLGNNGIFLKDLNTDKNNNVWGISANGNILPPINLYKYNEDEWIVYSIDQSLDLSSDETMTLLSLAIDSKNNVWIGTREGLIKFNEAETSVATFEQSNIKLFPNPTGDVLNIDLSDKQALSYTITDIEGRIIEQEHHHFNKQIAIDSKAIKTGTYFIKLKLSDNQIIQSKFIKE